jgi:DNA-directed RNA polymerase specialized sigma24 family protein
VSDESTAVLQGQLEQAMTGDAAARQRLLELTRDRLTRHARRFLHGSYARLEPLAQTDDVVQQLYLKILRNQDRFWVNADGEPSSCTLDGEKLQPSSLRSTRVGSR